MELRNLIPCEIRIQGYAGLERSGAKGLIWLLDTALSDNKEETVGEQVVAEEGREMSASDREIL